MAEPVPDPHRLERVHVVGVRLDRSGRFVVACSDGIDVTWDEWCDWGCAELRRAGRAALGAEGGGDSV